MSDCQNLTVDEELYQRAREGKLEYSTDFKKSDITRLEKEGFIFESKDESPDSETIRATAKWNKALAGLANTDYNAEEVTQKMLDAFNEATRKAFDDTKSPAENNKAFFAAMEKLLSDFPKQLINEMRSNNIATTQAMYLWLTSTLYLIIQLKISARIYNFLNH